MLVVTGPRCGTTSARRAFVLAIAIGTLGVAGAGCDRGGASRSISATSVQFGRFAGYAQIGPVVRSLSATITVPQASTARAHQAAVASTWVGAEALPDNARPPFIQVGVEELPVGTDPKDSGYEVFWADTENLLPSPLFFAHAGDRLSASLTLSHRHWTIGVADGAMHRRVVTAEEGTGSFQLALWFQEDLAYNHPKWTVYPRLTGLRLSDLAVDGHAPKMRDVSPVWMSADSGLSPAGKTVIEPSALNHDAFTLQPGHATVSASAVRVLDKLSRGYYATYKPLLRLVDATGTTPRLKLAGWVSEMSKALTNFEKTLRRQHWPSSAEPRVNALLTAVRAQLRLTQGLIHGGPASPFTQRRAAWIASNPAVEIALARLQHALHLPWQS